MDRIKEIFATRSKVFIAYITAGYPTVTETVKIMRILVENGVDIIELGYPFSDPTADGEVIQESSQTALNNQFRQQDYFTILGEFRNEDTKTPVIVFSYFNPIFSTGVDTFAKNMADAGGDGMLIVDLPFEEQDEIRPILDSYGIHLIQLISPTTSEARARKILNTATGFVYQLSLCGVTGERDTIGDTIPTRTNDIKKLTDLPVTLGFGISKKEQINEIIHVVDGIIIGSAIVRTIRDNIPKYESHLIDKITQFSDSIHCTL